MDHIDDLPIKWLHRGPKIGMRAAGTGSFAFSTSSMVLGTTYSRTVSTPLSPDSILPDGLVVLIHQMGITLARSSFFVDCQNLHSRDHPFSDQRCEEVRIGFRRYSTNPRPEVCSPIPDTYLLHSPSFDHGGISASDRFMRSAILLYKAQRS